MVIVSSAPLQPFVLLQQQQEQLPVGQYGAMASFIGTMRDFNDDNQIECMTLEHYPGMTESALEATIANAETRWPLLQCFIAHRVGDVYPNDPIVLTACWSAHRKAAFEACRYLMEDLKSTAPFWKKERLQGGGTRWVEKNTPGY